MSNILMISNLEIMCHFNGKQIKIIQFSEQLGEPKIEEKDLAKKKYSVPSYERRDTFAI